jgi:hypothetical protein
MPLKDPVAKRKYAKEYYIRSGGLARQRKARERKASRLRPEHCECCGRLNNPVTDVLCFDHDHKTGEFRGWLCHACNKALGYVEDSRDRLQLLINYLDLAELLK